MLRRLAMSSCPLLFCALLSSHFANKHISVRCDVYACPSSPLPFCSLSSPLLAISSPLLSCSTMPPHALLCPFAII